MADLPLRVGITGSAGTGKTALATALAKELALPLIGEEVRAYLTMGGEKRSVSTLRDLPIADRRRVFESLFESRLERERELESFVADNTSLDYKAYALHHGIYDDLLDPAAAPLLVEPARAVGSYDAVFVLPHGVLPYVRDGVRSDSALPELRFQHLMENVVRRSVAAHRAHMVPHDCVRLDDRVRFARAVLERSGYLPTAAIDAPCREKPGVVYLVGAGPGHPELLTVRARELLRRADVVAPDKLLPPELLAEIPRGAEIVPVGHRGRGARTAENRIHPAIIAAAHAGKNVVRLKVGDPMLFGRGAEEAEELRAAGVPYEIVPGVSAAFGAAAYAGIPLTHRDHASDVTFATGHESSSERPSRTSWSGLGAGTGTIVLYMAAQRLEKSLARLVAAGRPRTTPAAYVAGATHVAQRVIVGTLDDLIARAREEDRTVPAIVVVGAVVAKRGVVDWLAARRPLFGRVVLIARARSGASRIAAELRELGARVVESPCIEDSAAVDADALHAALATDFEGVVLGDAEAVRFLRLAANELAAHDRRELFARPVVALTTAAAAALEEIGSPAAAVARGSCSNALRAAVDTAFGDRRGRVLVPGPAGGRASLVAALRGADLDPCEITVFARSYSFARNDIVAFDVALYPSSSAVRVLFQDTLSARLRDVPAVSIGPQTTLALRNAGVRWIEQAPEDSIEQTIALTLRVLAAPLAEKGATR